MNTIDAMKQALNVLEHGAVLAAAGILREAIAREKAQTVEPVADSQRQEAYDLIDRFLRNNSDDEDYSCFSAALETLLTHPAPPLSGERAEKISDLRRTAKEIADAGHAGWGNVCTDAANMLAADAQYSLPEDTVSHRRTIAENPAGAIAIMQGMHRRIDALVADAQDEWHRGRAAGIEECERVNAELKKPAQQTKGGEDEQVRSEVDAVGGCQSMEMSGTGFVGGRDALVAAMVALLKLDAAGALVPHGIGGHARTLLTAAVAMLSAQRGEVQQGFTTGHCKEHSKPGGCQLHNLQCGYPDCDRKPAAPQPPQAERVPMTDTELRSIVDPFFCGGMSDQDFKLELPVYRAIEAHHHIGVKP